MDAVVLDGFSNRGETTLVAQLLSSLAGQGYTAEAFALRDKAIAPCAGCFGCWTKTPGECVIDDDGRAVARAVARADLVVFLTPVTFGGVSSELKKALDRLIPNISPFFVRVRGETHHQKRYRHPPSLIAVGFLPHADARAEAIFKTLIEDNATNLRSPRVAAAVLTLDKPAEMDTALRALVGAVKA